MEERIKELEAQVNLLTADLESEKRTSENFKSIYFDEKAKYEAAVALLESVVNILKQ